MTSTEIRKATPGPIQLVADTAVFSVRMYFWTAKRLMLTALGSPDGFRW